ncbi:MAG: class I SAM-dependent methyltransferase, partial [bacterium]
PVFDRSGLAALSDLKDKGYHELFLKLEKSQQSFLLKEKEFRSPDYPWPSDALHWWSRIWEYPYIYHHLRQLKDKLPNEKPRVLDLGSGVTFFPFTVANHGYHLSCLDPDPVCKQDFDKAILAVGDKSLTLDYSLLEGNRYPFPDQTFDIVYSISVLEHIEDLSSTIREILRVLKEDGSLFLTIDIDLRGDSEIGVEKYHSLKSHLAKHFDFLYPETTIHPKDLLTSENSPFPIPDLKGINKYSTQFKQRLLKPLLGRKPGPWRAPRLAVEGMILRKRQTEKIQDSGYRIIDNG